ncbi:MAG: TIGR02594 family protein [Hyphomicrobium sp.]
MEQPAWMATAWAEYGVRETPGAANTPSVLAYYKEAGRADIRQDAVAWCAAFTGAMLARAGMKGTGSLLARSYLDWGTTLEAGRIGAVAVLSRGADPGAGHVGFVVGRNDKSLFLLGGNQDDGVSVAPFDIGRLLGYRWPNEVLGEGAFPTSPADLPSASYDAATETIFAAALAHVLEMEGGFSNDPYDPGGPTNRGITLEVFARYRGVALETSSRAGLIEELKRISDDAVAEIYHTRYWQPGCCGILPPPLALFHFDACVNHGVAGAARLLQRAVDVDVDGEIGLRTLAAVGARQPLAVVAAYADLRRQRYRALPHFWRFGRGWLARVDAGEAQAARLASSTNLPSATSASAERSAAPPPNRAAAEPSNPISSKGERSMEPITYPDTSDDQSSAKWWGHSKTIWGAMITAAATLAPVLGPLLGIDLSGDVVRQIGEQGASAIQAVMALIGTLLTIYGRVTAVSQLSRRDLSLKL